MKALFSRIVCILMTIGAAWLCGCVCPTGGNRGITRQPFGSMPDGTPVELFKMRNRNGAEVWISNYGGIVVAIKVPDRDGKMGDVVLGYPELAGYLKDSPYFGALVGRFGNRIAKGKFTLDGKDYTLAVNNPPNALHGGLKGFDKVVWTPKIIEVPGGQALQLNHVSKDGEEGYPGNLTVTAVYQLMPDNALKLEHTATTDKPTVLNLSHHSYFNLAGRGDVLNHQVTIFADTFTPVDSTLIPTGELRSVEGTPFDFRRPTAVGARINQQDEQLIFGKGYDHNWVIKKQAKELALMARVYEPTSGRVLEVFSIEPGLQFYTGNFLDGTITGKGGWVYQFRNGLTLEPQHYPDSPNQPTFPTTVLRPGEIYTNTIIYKFSVETSAENSSIKL